MTDLDELHRTIAAVADRVGPSVVALGRGCGVVIDTGHVLTNAHNLDGEQTAAVRFADGRTVGGTVTAIDLDGDLAVVTVETGDAPPVAWAEQPPTTGTPVLAVTPTRSGRPRVTFGTVSADQQTFRGPRGRRIHGAVEHVAPLGRGASGGPVVDLGGRVVGINTHRRAGGFYLAQPTTPELRGRVDELRHGRAPRTVHLGIAIAPAAVARRLRSAVGLPPRDGLLVRDVTADGPAARAGLREGDLIVTVGSDAVVTPDDLLDRLRGRDGSMTLGIVRGVDEIEVDIAADQGDA